MSSKEIGERSGPKTAPKNEVSFSEKLNNFMYAHRRLFVSLGVIVLAGVLGLGVWSVVSSSILKNSTIAIEALEKDYQDALSPEGLIEAAQSASLLAHSEKIMAKYGKRYASARASVIKAEILFAMNDLIGAQKAYADTATLYPSSHLAPVALANAATAAEDMGDSEKAIEYLLRAEKDYPAAPGAGRIRLSIGRIYESTKQYGNAMEVYTRLIASGTESDWTKLAHTRIIYLKSQGLVQ